MLAVNVSSGGTERLRKEAFRANTSLRKKLLRGQRRNQYRLPDIEWEDQPHPMFSARNINVDLADKTRRWACGGIGAIHLLARQIGLIEAIDRRLNLLEIHKPYHESDHVLNITYNLLCGGRCLEHIAQRRNDEVFADALPEKAIHKAFDDEHASFADDPDAVYTPSVALWAFRSQVLFKDEQRSCVAAVTRVVLVLVALERGPCSNNLGAHCRARGKLSAQVIRRVAVEVADGCKRRLWLSVGRHVLNRLRPHELWAAKQAGWAVADWKPWGSFVASLPVAPQRGSVSGSSPRARGAGTARSSTRGRFYHGCLTQRVRIRCPTNEHPAAPAETLSLRMPRAGGE